MNRYGINCPAGAASRISKSLIKCIWPWWSWLIASNKLFLSVWRRLLKALWQKGQISTSLPPLENSLLPEPISELLLSSTSSLGPGHNHKLLLQDVVLVDMRVLMSSCIFKKGKNAGNRWWCFRRPMDANGNRHFCIINLENDSFLGGQRIFSEEGGMLQSGRNTGSSFSFIPFGKWKNHRGVWLLLWILSTFFRVI